MIVGLFAGLLAFGFARIFGEPQIDAAIAFEELMSSAANEAAEPELVTRETQAGIGLFTGVMVYGAALGGIFSLVFAFTYGRASKLSPRGLSAVLALAGFVALVLVPDIKYPANPPAVGSAETIGVRTQMFFVMLIASVAGTALAFMLAGNLRTRFGGWNAAIIAGLAFVAFIVVVQMLLPSINEVPENFSASVLWRFRAASLGIHAIVWTVIGLGFGILAERTLAKSGNYRAVSLAR
jgi:hypothetical protein